MRTFIVVGSQPLRPKPAIELMEKRKLEAEKIALYDKETIIPLARITEDRLLD